MLNNSNTQPSFSSFSILLQTRETRGRCTLLQDEVPIAKTRNPTSEPRGATLESPPRSVISVVLRKCSPSFTHELKVFIEQLCIMMVVSCVHVYQLLLYMNYLILFLFNSSLSFDPNFQQSIF